MTEVGALGTDGSPVRRDIQRRKGEAASFALRRQPRCDRFLV